MSQLTSAQRNFFAENGYLIVEDVFDDTFLNSLWTEYTDRLDVVATEMFASGQISSTYADLPFDQRYATILREDTSVFAQLEICFPLINENFPVDATMFSGPATLAMMTHPNLMDVVESIIGGEIYANPVQHIRLKPPQKGLSDDVAGNSYIGKTTWHQDQGALLDEANETQVLTTWVAITDCPKEMGCLVVAPRSHKKGGGTLTTHCPGQGIASENYIPGALLGDDQGNKQVLPLPVNRGSVILLNQYTEHAALPNRSDKLRWSFDLRFNPVGQPTGRPAFPGFVARSRRHPETELRNADQWGRLWVDAKDRIVSGEYEGQIFNAERWKKYADSPVCA